MFGLTLLAQVNPRELVRQSIANGQKAWKDSRSYSYTKLDIRTQFNGDGQVVSTDRNLYWVRPVCGNAYQEHIAHDGKPVAADETERQQKELLQRECAGPAVEKAQETQQRHQDTFEEIPDAFDFKIIGEEVLPTGPAFVVRATPRNGYEPRSRYGRVFSKVSGKLWIDKRDIQWVKAEGIVTDSVSFGWFIARLAKGSQVRLEQTRLPDGTWVPKKVEANASARALFVFNRNFQQTITYTGYQKGSIKLTQDLRTLKTELMR
ncbi:MAG: hypothetical protein U0Q18_33240 [Bryobacteraceae bacterium]